MSMGKAVVYKLGSALNLAISRIRAACGANCKVHWIARRAVHQGDYVVTPNGEVARVESVSVERMSPREVADRVKKRGKVRPARPIPEMGHKRILSLVTIWPTKGSSLKHTRPGDAPLKAAFRIAGVGVSTPSIGVPVGVAKKLAVEAARGVGDYDIYGSEDEVNAPGGYGDTDFGDDGFDDVIEEAADKGVGQLPMLRSAIDAARFPLKPGDLPDTTFVTEQGLKRQDVNLSDADNFGM